MVRDSAPSITNVQRNNGKSPIRTQEQHTDAKDSEEKKDPTKSSRGSSRGEEAFAVSSVDDLLADSLQINGRRVLVLLVPDCIG